jgi:hypothetical protein
VVLAVDVAVIDACGPDPVVFALHADRRGLARDVIAAMRVSARPLP